MKYRYPGIHAFSVENSALFCGRKTDENHFYELLRLEQLVVLYGKSGYGKTSLIQAAILPRLERETDYVTLHIRFRNNAPGFPDPVNRTVEFVDQWCQKQETTDENHHWFTTLLSENNSLWYHLKCAQALSGRKRFILVFDQFEEIFTYSEGAVIQFRAQLAELLYTRIPQDYRDTWNRLASSDAILALPETAESFFFEELDVHVVFSLRVDYMHYMNRMKDYLPLILRHCYELDALTMDQARKAIVEPAARTDLQDYTPPFSYSEEIVNILLEYLSNKGKEKIESFQLQLICRHIEETFVDKKGKLIIVAADFGPDYNAQIEYFRQVNRGYYQSCISSIKPPILQSVARQIIESDLIIPKEKRRSTVDGGTIIARYMEKGASEDLLQQLKNTYLIRAEKSERGTLYELSHDALIEPLLQAKEEREQKELRRRQRRERLFILVVALFFGTIALTFFKLWDTANKLVNEKIHLVESLRKTSRKLGIAIEVKERSILKLQTTNKELIRWQLDLAEKQILSLNYKGCLKNLHLAVQQAEGIEHILPPGQNNNHILSLIGEAMLEPCFFFIETGNKMEGLKILAGIGKLIQNLEMKQVAENLLINPQRSDLRQVVHQIMKKTMPERFKFIWARYYPVMKKVDGGAFIMGCDPNEDNDCNSQEAESSKLKVVVETFAMAQSETTVWQYNLFKTAIKKSFIGRNLQGNYPCGYLTWKEATLYANWLSYQHGFSPAYEWSVSDAPNWEQDASGYRLPTEAEWELAARGGGEGVKDNFKFSGGDSLDLVGWFKNNTAKSSIPSSQGIKTKKPNRLGLYDMSGNLSEWCWDISFNKRINMQNDRVLKGGNFNSLERDCAVFNRDAYRFDAAPKEIVGFRLVRR